MSTAAFIIGGIMALVATIAVYLVHHSGTAEALSGQEKVNEALQDKVGELEGQLRTKWAAEARKDKEDAAKVTDVSSAIGFARRVLSRSQGASPNPGS